MLFRSGHIRRCGTVLMTAGLAAVIGCMAVFASVRLPEEEQAALELKKVLKIPVPEAVALSAARYAEEENAYTELLSVLDSDGAVVLSDPSGEAIARKDLVAVLDTVLAAAPANEISPAEPHAAETPAAETSQTAETQTADVREEPEDLPPAGEEYDLELGMEEERIRIYRDDLAAVFPKMVTWSAMTWGRSLPSFEYLLRYSLAYADIVVNDGEIFSTGGRYNSISPDNGVHYVIMVFDSPLHLCGYGCGRG